MSEMDRRDFLLALGSLGGLGLAGCADVPGLLSPSARTTDLAEPVPVSRICTNVRTRRNIYCLSESHPDVLTYRAGVAAMQALPASDETSWEAQRAIHWTNLSPQTSIFNQCEHGTLFFLSWHRMYLYWFERIIRHKTNNQAFALPYWGYSPTGTRNLPVHFRVPANSSNVLYTPNRNAASNAGTPMNASLVDPGLALLEFDFYDFQDLLETTPHDSVHVPGVQGWMGSVPTAALDPIFYLHHCNIDRLWCIWLAQGGGRANPTDSPWLNTVYQFYDENGATVNMTGAQIVHTANQLCYQYASPKCLIADTDADVESTQIKALDPSAASVADPIGSRPPRTSPYTLAEEQVSVKLGGAPVTVTVPIPAGTRDELRGFSEAKEGNRLALLLQDLVLERDPALYYEIYVNLPGDPAQAVYTSPHYAGNLTFFSATMPGGHGGHSRRVNLLRTYAYLRSRGQWSDEEVRVTFVPRGGFEGDDPAKLVAGVQVTIGRITLQIQ
jgi:tyrosinase